MSSCNTRSLSRVQFLHVTDWGMDTNENSVSVRSFSISNKTKQNPHAVDMAVQVLKIRHCEVGKLHRADYVTNQSKDPT